MNRLLKLWALFLGFFCFGGSAMAVTPYDDLVTAADISGLQTTQVTILVGVMVFVVVSVAFAILASSMRKAKGASR